MDVTAVTDSINKKQTNSSIKHSHSITIQKKDVITSVLNKINVRDYFFHERLFADIKIKLNHQIIWCNKALLAAASPILCKELLKMNPKDDILSLDDINLDEFLLILQFIYPIFNPEINEGNISCLIKLSHRFQFDILKHACRFYIIKYLSTIRRVFSKYQNSEVEGDSFIHSNHNDDTSENENYRQSDLIEFHDGTCIDTYEIILNLCQWLKIYFYEDDIAILQSIISIIQQISVDNLNQIMNSIDMNDDIKVYIYKKRARYLEEIYQIKHIA